MSQFLNEAPTFERYGTKFQENLVQLILDDRAFADQVSEVLDINRIGKKVDRILWSMITGMGALILTLIALVLK